MSANKAATILAHLFGHTVQWNSDPAAFEIGRRYRPLVDEPLFPNIIEYELEAARYGLAVCHEAGVRRIEQWFSNYADCDRKYLPHYYRPGRKTIFTVSGRKITPRSAQSDSAVQAGPQSISHGWNCDLIPAPLENLRSAIYSDTGWRDAK